MAGTTPEGNSLRAILGFLRLIRIGKVERMNVGQVRVGAAPTHPWAKDTRRIVRFGEKGASDLKVELAMGDPRIPQAFQGRDLFIEVKRPGWKPPQPPGPEASTSTRAKFAHFQRQAAFLARQRMRGNLATFSTTPEDLARILAGWGFVSIPIPGPALPRRRN